MDEIKLDLLSLENEINDILPELTVKVKRELEFLKKDIAYLEEDIADLKEAWELIGDDYKNIKDAIERI